MHACRRAALPRFAPAGRPPAGRFGRPPRCVTRDFLGRSKRLGRSNGGGVIRRLAVQTAFKRRSNGVQTFRALRGGAQKGAKTVPLFRGKNELPRIDLRILPCRSTDGGKKKPQASGLDPRSALFRGSSPSPADQRDRGFRTAWSDLTLLDRGPVGSGQWEVGSAGSASRIDWALRRHARRSSSSA